MRTVLWISIVAFLGTYICNSVADPDLWWHIVIGRWIIANRDVPHVDYWNLFGAGQPWRAYSWLTDAMFAAVNHSAGPVGLLYLQIVFALALAISFCYVTYRLAGDAPIGLLLGGFSTVACFNHFTLRPQVLVWIWAAWVVLLSERLYRGEPLRKVAPWLFFVAMLWANCHLTAALGLIIVVLWSFSKEGLRTTAGGAAAYFLGTLATPYLGGEWVTLAKKSGHPLKFQAIAEFQPATILQYSTGFLIIAFAVVIALLVSDPRRFRIGAAVCAAGFLAAGLAVVKFLPFGVFMLGGLAAVWFSSANRELAADGEISEQALESLGGLGEGLVRYSRWAHGLSTGLFLPLAFVCWSVITVKILGLSRNPINLGVTPQTSVDFIKDNNLPKPILNEFGAGGYLMYRFTDEQGKPELLVPIDGRTNVNSPEAWEMYTASFLGKREWRKFIDVVKPQTILWRQGSAFTALLFASGEWCRVFSSGSEEDDYVVFVQRRAFEQSEPKLTSVNCAS